MSLITALVFLAAAHAVRAEIRCSTYDEVTGNCSVCEAGYYGHRCDLPCGNCAGSGSCDVLDGSCPDDCLPGFAGSDCKKPCRQNCVTCHMHSMYCVSCAAGFHGMYCNLACLGHCLDSVCSRDGVCPACTPGFHAPLCEELCPDHCVLAGCNQTSGDCDGDIGCDDGWTGPTCAEEAGPDPRVIIAGTVAAGAIVIALIVSLIAHFLLRRFRLQHEEHLAHTELKPVRTEQVAESV